MFEHLGPAPFSPEERLLRLESTKVPFPPQSTELTFLLSHHDSEQDLPPNFSDMVAEADVVLMELMCWTKGDYERWNLVSQGDSTAFNAVTTRFQAQHDNGYDTALAKGLYGSQKPVRFPDLPYSRKNYAVWEKGDDIIDAFFDTASTLNGILRAKRAAQTYDIEEKFFKRDKYFLKSLYPTIIEPFKNKSIDHPIRALFPVGALHRTLPHLIRKQAARQAVANQHTVVEVYHGDIRHPLHELYLAYLQKLPLTDEALLRHALVGEDPRTTNYTQIEAMNEPELRMELTKRLGAAGIHI